MDLSLLTAAVDIGSLTEVLLSVGAVMVGFALVSLAVQKVRETIDVRRIDRDESELAEARDRERNHDE